MVLRLHIPVLLAQVFPAAICQDDHDLSSLQALGNAQRDIEHCATARTGEDAFLIAQLERAQPRLPARYQFSTIEQGLVEYGGNEAIGEAAQSLDTLALQWLRSNNSDRRIMLL